MDLELLDKCIKQKTTVAKIGKLFKRIFQIIGVPILASMVIYLCGVIFTLGMLAFGGYKYPWAEVFKAFGVVFSLCITPLLMGGLARFDLEVLEDMRRTGNITRKIIRGFVGRMVLGYICSASSLLWIGTLLIFLDAPKGVMWITYVLPVVVCVMYFCLTGKVRKLIKNMKELISL